MSPSTPRALVQRQFGAQAAAYAASDVHAKGESLARMVELVAPQSHWHVLDVATGAGHTALAFAPHVSKVVAADITEEMLAQAARLAGERGFANVETAEADAQSLPFDDASFDLVTCRLAAHHFPDCRAFVRDARRVLRPGGLLALDDNIAPDADILPEVPADAVAAAAADYNAFEALRDPSHARALALNEWIAHFAEQGLDVLHAECATKAMDFQHFAQRMRCDARTVASLVDVLNNGPAALRAFLRPHVIAERLHFVLHEAIVLGRRCG